MFNDEVHVSTGESTVCAREHLRMQPTAKSSLQPNNGNQIISMQQCAVRREAAAAL